MELEEQKKHQISKILIALLIIIVILFIILKIVDLKNNSKYEKYKLDKTKEYVYTKYTSTKNNAKVPFINIKKEVITQVNNEIENDTRIYRNSDDPNKTVTYRYNQNKNILSIVLTFRDIDEEERLIYSYKTYVFDLANNCKILTDEEILKKFKTTYAHVNNTIGKAMQEKYKDEVKKGYLDKNECNYKCFLEMRNITNYLDNVNYYIEEGSLVVYKAYDVYSIYGEEEYYTRNDFKFIIK